MQSFSVASMSVNRRQCKKILSHTIRAKSKHGPYSQRGKVKRCTWPFGRVSPHNSRLDLLVLLDVPAHLPCGLARPVGLLLLVLDLELSEVQRDVLREQV